MSILSIILILILHSTAIASPFEVKHIPGVTPSEPRTIKVMKDCSNSDISLRDKVRISKERKARQLKERKDMNEFFIEAFMFKYSPIVTEIYPDRIENRLNPFMMARIFHSKGKG